MTEYSEESFNDVSLDAQILCRVEYVHIVWGVEPEFARLRPIAIEDDGDWDPIADAKNLFGDEGLVFWWKPPVGCKDLLWRLSLADQPKYDGTRNRDRYQVKDGSTSPVEELFSCGMTLSDDQFRLLLDEGIELQKPPLGKMLFRLEGSRCAGPLELSLVNGKWSCPDNDIRSRVPVSRFNETDFRVVQNGETRHSVLAPRCRLPIHSEYLNAQTPIDVIHSLVKRVRRLDQRTYEALNVTYAAYDAYVGALSKAQLPADQGLMERARGDRLKQLISTLKEDSTVLVDFGNALLEHSAVAKKVEDAVQLEVQRKIESASSTIEEKLSGLRTTLADLEHQLVSRKATLLQTEARLRSTEEESRVIHARLSEDFSRQLDDMLQNPVKAIAQNAIFKALTARGTGGSAQKTKESGEGEKDSAASKPPASTEVNDFQELRRHFGSRVADLGVSILAAPTVLGSCLAGNMPLLFGPHTDDLLQAFSDVVAGGRVFRISISASTHEVQDLFIQQDVATGISRPTPLRKIVDDCRKSDKLVVVCLEGVNRAPIESFLSPLLSSLAAAGNEDQPRIPTAVLHDGSIDWFSWPSNALLVGSIIEGPSSFPIPRTMLERITLVPTWLGPLLKSAASDVEIAYFELNVEAWKAAKEKVRKGAVSSEACQLIDALELPSAISARSAKQLVAAFEMTLGAPAAWIVSTALGTQWLPIATVNEGRSLRAKLTGELAEDWMRTVATASTELIWDGSIGGLGR